MKKKVFLVWFFSVIILGLSYSQDTITVQTLTFDSITTRKGSWHFPEKQGDFRKILMYHTLKCDTRTTADKYPCGAWDYITSTNIYHHTGLLDSTLEEQSNFLLNDKEFDMINYRTSPVYSCKEWIEENVLYDDTISFSAVTIGNVGDDFFSVYPDKSKSYYYQCVFKKDELESAGLKGGVISGINLLFNGGSVTANHFRIEAANVLSNTEPGEFGNILSELVYDQRFELPDPGLKNFHFSQQFVWDGQSDLLIRLYFKGLMGNSFSVKAQKTQDNFGSYRGNEDYAIQVNGSGDRVELAEEYQLNAKQERTYELWGKAEVFNNGGLFQTGKRGTAGADFSFRTTNTVNTWRVQLWGEPDFDVLLSGSLNLWHHYCVTYKNGKTCVYYDGNLVECNTSDIISTANSGIDIGRWYGSYFKGQIDQFRSWNIALDEVAIRDGMNKKADASHPFYNNLLCEMNFDEGKGFVASNSKIGSSGNLKGDSYWSIYDNPWQKNFIQFNLRPSIVIEQGSFDEKIVETGLYDTLYHIQNKLVLFEDPDILPVATDTLEVWLEEYGYTYDEDGNKKDSVFFTATNTIERTYLNYYSEPFEVILDYEIARFITPYGINLDLGEDGWTWIYDVTDYAPLLKGDVELRSGNNQELIDLKFLFIEGTPPRDVLQIDQIWGKKASYKYKHLASDEQLSAKWNKLHPDANTYKVKFRITGHGHNSSTGSYPHCCEWKDNQHSLYIGGRGIATWHIFQDTECAMNPLYPQGGTWPGAREGWCPGDMVDDLNAELLPYLFQADSVHLDYGITPVPANNPGMGDGNYVIASHLIQYTDYKYDNDAELYDVIAPSTLKYNSRINPLCSSPVISLRNSGKNDLVKVDFNYSVSGGTEYNYSWEGELKSMETELIRLPIAEPSFWLGDGGNVFSVEICSVNGSADEYPGNNHFNSSFNLPDLYKDNFVIYLKTNKHATENKLTIIDVTGAEVYSRNVFSPETEYKIPLNLKKGCYTLKLYDSGHNGLYYWAYPQAGSGILKIEDNSGKTLKIFESQFGMQIDYAFTIGSLDYITNPLPDKIFMVYPNPTNGKLIIDHSAVKSPVRIDVYSNNGSLLMTKKISLKDAMLDELDISNFSAGVYYIKMSTNLHTETHKIMKM